MFEEQADVLRRYHGAGIAVGKIQVSSAVCLRLDRLPESDAVRGGPAGRVRRERAISTKLPSASTRIAGPYSTKTCPSPWRQIPWGSGVYFHVPIYLERFGRLEATQPAILECLRALRELGLTPHLEVERTPGVCCPQSSPARPGRGNRPGIGMAASKDRRAGSVAAGVGRPWHVEP